MDTTAIQIKVRFCNDLRNWESIPVTMSATADRGQLVNLVRHLRTLANAPLISSVRWNVEGSLQGHYFANQTGDSKDYLNR
jgi:hypothetical protein